MRNYKQTIAQQLKIKDFPYVVKDDKGNQIYYENSDWHWYKREYDDNGNEIYYENSIGDIRDNRPKDVKQDHIVDTNKMVSSVDAIMKFMKENGYFIGNDLYQFFNQAKAIHKEEIMNARRNGSYKVTEKYGETRTNIQYYNETFSDESNN